MYITQYLYPTFHYKNDNLLHEDTIKVQRVNFQIKISKYLIQLQTLFAVTFAIKFLFLLEMDILCQLINGLYCNYINN